jgi:hypothetical protein
MWLRDVSLASNRDARYHLPAVSGSPFGAVTMDGTQLEIQASTVLRHHRLE